jgi:Flp pilus assembly protein TadG
MLARRPSRSGPGRGPRRRGSAILEFAVVAPILMTFVMGIIEMGRVVMLAQIATNAAREGTRYAVQGNANADTIDTYVRTYLSGAGLRSASSTGTSSVTTAVEYQSGGSWATTTDPSAQPSGTAIRVTVQIDYTKESWLPTQLFVGSNAKVSGAAVMRRE